MTNQQQEKWYIKHSRNIIVLIGWVVFFIFYKFYWRPKSEIVLRRVSPQQFQGKVRSIYRKEHQHNEMYAVLSNGYQYGVYADWESKIEVGDSLTKKAGTTYVELTKKNGVRDTLDYRVLVKNWDK